MGSWELLQYCGDFWDERGVGCGMSMGDVDGTRIGGIGHGFKRIFPSGMDFLTIVDTEISLSSEF
jgi:hypothetical protein